MIVGLIGGVSRPTEFCRTFFVRRGEGTPPYGATPSPYLSLWERWPSAARTERVGTLRKHAAVASFLVCTASSFSPDLGSYAAVASIRTYTALSWIPSQSPAVTALPKGEPRACTPLHSMKMERIGADTLHELFSTIRQLDGTPLSLIQTSAAYGRRFPVSWPAEPSDPQRSPAFSGGRAAAPPDGTAPSSACRCGQRTGRAPAKF